MKLTLVMGMENPNDDSLGFNKSPMLREHMAVD